MEGERISLSRWSCCGPAANNLNIYFLYLGQNFANSYTGERLYTWVVPFNSRHKVITKWLIQTCLQDYSLKLRVSLFLVCMSLHMLVIVNIYPWRKNRGEITPFDLGSWSNRSNSNRRQSLADLYGWKGQRGSTGLQKAEKWDSEGNKCLSYIKSSFYGSFWHGSQHWNENNETSITVLRTPIVKSSQKEDNLKCHRNTYGTKGFKEYTIFPEKAGIR